MFPSEVEIKAKKIANIDSNFIMNPYENKGEAFAI